MLAFFVSTASPTFLLCGPPDLTRAWSIKSSSRKVHFPRKSPRRMGVVLILALSEEDFQRVTFSFSVLAGLYLPGWCQMKGSQLTLCCVVVLIFHPIIVLLFV